MTPWSPIYGRALTLLYASAVRNLVHAAVMSGSATVVETACELVAPEEIDGPNLNGDTPLMFACRSSHPVIANWRSVSRLLAHGADAGHVNPRTGESPISIAEAPAPGIPACETNRAMTLSLLLKAGLQEQGKLTCEFDFGERTERERPVPTATLGNDGDKIGLGTETARTGESTAKPVDGQSGERPSSTLNQETTP